jgi:hypothetical protein
MKVEITSTFLMADDSVANDNRVVTVDRPEDELVTNEYMRGQLFPLVNLLGLEHMAGWLSCHWTVIEDIEI